MSGQRRTRQRRGNGKPSSTAKSRQASAQRAEPTRAELVTRPYGWLRTTLRRYSNLQLWTPNPVSTTILLLAVRLLGAAVNNIADCDETYNYWEPLHFLLYGVGLQTWEYSPVFAIRSYAFLYPFVAVARAGQQLSAILSTFGNVFMGEKLVVFYSIRIVQALACVSAEVHLYDSTAFRFGPSVARILLLFLASSAGMFRASTELLPSSFAMIGMMHACGFWFVGSFNLAVACVVIAAGLGWPFAALLGLPIALHVMYRRGPLHLARSGFACAALLAAFMIPIDSVHFGKFVLAPLNIVLYNVFPVPGAGPDLYGTEPWTFYVVNLFLNCGIQVLLLSSVPVLAVLAALVSSSWTDSASLQHGLLRIIYLSPAFFWFATFFAQAHKEERFMAPIYPLIALVAAVCLHDWINFVDHVTRRVQVRGLVSLSILLRRGRQCAVMAVLLASAVLGGSRIRMQTAGFSAPMEVFNALSMAELQQLEKSSFLTDGRDINICMGRDWYRFPSHFFVPSNRFRLQFIRSSFSGILPLHYDVSKGGTRYAAEGVNMFNEEVEEQYMRPEDTCHYFIDTSLDHRGKGEHPGRPRDVKKLPDHNPFPQGSWQSAMSRPVVDLEASSPGFRAFWVPFNTARHVRYASLEVFRNAESLPISS